MLDVRAINRVGATGQRICGEFAGVDLLDRMPALSQQLRSTALMAHYATDPAEHTAILKQLAETRRAFSIAWAAGRSDAQSDGLTIGGNSPIGCSRNG